MSGAPGRVFYRIVATDPPTALDFLSNQARGLPRRPSETPDVWAGLSHYDTEAEALITVRRFPRLGRFIATMEIPEGSAFRVEQTYRPGHYTIWGEPEDFLRAVVKVVIVERAR